MRLIGIGLRQVDFSILDRLIEYLSLVSLVSLVLFHICLCNYRHVLLRRLVIAGANRVLIELSRLAATLHLTNHLWAALHRLIHELLAASSIRICCGTAAPVQVGCLFVVAHRGKALVRNAAKVTTPLMVGRVRVRCIVIRGAAPTETAAHVVLLGWLYELRLIHDVSDLFFEQAVGHTSHIWILHQICCLYCSVGVLRCSVLVAVWADWGCLLGLVFLGLTVATLVSAWVVFLKSCSFPIFVTIWKQGMMLSIWIVAIVHLKCGICSIGIRCVT